MRTHPRLDANQEAIVAALRAAHCSVLSLASIGAGCPDLLIGRGPSRCECGRVHLCPRTGRRYPESGNLLMEVKDAKNPLTEQQQEWHETWRGRLVVVRTLQDALRALGLHL